MVFYKESDFAETSIGDFPKDWKIVALGDVARVKGGKRVPKGEKLVDFKTGFPYVRIVDFKNSTVDVSGLKYLLPETHEKIKNYTISSDDVYISIAGTIGLAGLIPPELHGANLTENAAKLCDLREVRKEFLAYLLNSESLREQITGLVGKGTQPKLALFRIESLKLPLPSSSEQGKISELLGVVDSVIGLVDEVIAKTERLKKGLMQELLTKGIGHKEYKDTPIGKTPKEWEVVQLDGLILDVKNGFASGKRDEEGIVQIRMNNVSIDGRLLLDTYLKVPIPENIDVWLLKTNDFLFNNTNSIDLVGKSAIFKSAPFPCTFSNHFTRMRFREDRVLPEMILYHFIAHWEKGYFKSVAIRHVGQAAVHTQYLLRLKIPLPPLSEQKKIVDVLSTVDNKLALERKEKMRLQRIKRGLMDLLLTGKVRVKVD